MRRFGRGGGSPALAELAAVDRLVVQAHPPFEVRAEVQIVLGLGLFAVNVIVYWMVWCRWRKRGA